MSCRHAWSRGRHDVDDRRWRPRRCGAPCAGRGSPRSHGPAPARAATFEQPAGAWAPRVQPCPGHTSRATQCRGGGPPSERHGVGTADGLQDRDAPNRLKGPERRRRLPARGMDPSPLGTPRIESLRRFHLAPSVPIIDAGAQHSLADSIPRGNGSCRGGCPEQAAGFPFTNISTFGRVKSPD
jgi:hypothetical protein